MNTNEPKKQAPLTTLINLSRIEDVWNSYLFKRALSNDPENMYEELGLNELEKIVLKALVQDFNHMVDFD